MDQLKELIWLYNRMISHYPAAYHMSYSRFHGRETDDSKMRYFDYLIQYEVYLMIRRIYLKKLKTAKYHIRHSMVFSKSVIKRMNMPEDLYKVLLRIYEDEWQR